jgi:transcriptional regulator with XRE-family HTH domain
MYDPPQEGGATMTKSVFTGRYERFLKLLRQVRVEAALTQTEAAEKMGRPQSFVSKCESGERRVDVVELVEFCRVYGVSAVSFVKRLMDAE